MDWNDLPDELLDLVLSNIFARDRFNFSLVCRSWKTAVAALPVRHSPCLMFYLEKKRMWKIFQHNTFFYNNFPKLENAVICFSNHGWLLMRSRDNVDLFFYNPFNYHMIQLPPPRLWVTTLCFFHPPTSPECFVVGIATQLVFPYDMKIGVLKHGQDWNRNLIHIKSIFYLSHGPPILNNGQLYFLGVRGNLGVLGIGEHGAPIDWSVYTRCLQQRRLRRNIKEHYLIKPEGESEIFAVFAMNDDSRKIRVFKLSRWFFWDRVKDIGDRVFYVSNTSSFGHKTSVKSLANKIFFPKFHGDKVVYYSLDTQKYHSFEGDYSSDNVCGLKRFDFATWMVPTTTDHDQLPKESLAWSRSQMDEALIKQ